MIHKINTESYKKHLVQGIKDFENLERLLLANGSKSHLYINTAAGEIRIFMVSLFLYLIGENPYYSPMFKEEFFISQLQLMHRACLQSLHISVEVALNEVLKAMKIKPQKSLADQKNKLIVRIKNKLPNNCRLKIRKELEEIGKIGHNYAQFDDYLRTVLRNVVLFEDTNRDKDYKKGAKQFFRALSIVRNKQSHSNQSLTENEKIDLVSGGLKKMIDSDGKLRMGINYYKLLFDGVVNFFNLLINRV